MPYSIEVPETIIHLLRLLHLCVRHDYFQLEDVSKEAWSLREIERDYDPDTDDFEDWPSCNYGTETTTYLAIGKVQTPMGKIEVCAIIESIYWDAMAAIDIEDFLWNIHVWARMPDDEVLRNTFGHLKSPAIEEEVYIHEDDEEIGFKVPEPSCVPRKVQKWLDMSSQ